MQPFDRYFKHKMQDERFKRLYEAECNACPTTMKIFAKAHREDICLDRLARETNVRPDELAALRDADHCIPGLVKRLCAHLGIAPPENCSREPKNLKT